MSDPEVLIDGEEVELAEGWRLEWTDRPHGVGRLVDGKGSIPVVVEGAGTDWSVTLHGRRIPVTVRSWRERILAEADTSARGPTGALAVKATLPGLVVAVRVAPGDEVGEGDSLVTIEAMKMQNEVRAPRAARVTAVAVTAGQVVVSGAELVTLE
jgi:acetyl/propionyl-CoA carboxylase alpha subunit